MKKRTILLTVVALFAASALSFASDDALIGTWKLNEAKSKIGAGMGKNSTVTYAAVGDSIRVTIDGVDAAGKPTHSEWTGKIDGKDYPLTGDAASDTRSYKAMGARTYAVTQKKGGKTTLSGTVTVSADGKTRTVEISGMDSMGMKMSMTAVYDKQ